MKKPTPSPVMPPFRLGEGILTMRSSAELEAWFRAIENGCDEGVWREFIQAHVSRLESQSPKPKIQLGWGWRDGDTFFCRSDKQLKRERIPQNAPKRRVVFELVGLEWNVVSITAILAKQMLGCTKPSHSSMLADSVDAGFNVLAVRLTELKAEARGIDTEERQRLSLPPPPSDADMERISAEVASLLTLCESCDASRTAVERELDACRARITPRKAAATYLEERANALLELLPILPRDEHVRLAIGAALDVGRAQERLNLLNDEGTVNKLHTALEKERTPGVGTLDIKAAWGQVAESTGKKPTPMLVIRHMVQAKTALAIPDTRKAPTKVYLLNESQDTPLTWAAFRRRCETVLRG
jgi:hypothetical protein